MSIKHTLLIFGLLVLLIACGERTQKNTTEEPVKAEVTPKPPIYDPNDPKSMLAAVEHAHGGWGDLWHKKDVEYRYDYRSAQGKADVSTERYIFDTEASFGNYTQHDINAMPGTDGDVMQFFDGKTTIATLAGTPIKDPQVLAGSTFLRRANYFWFVMPYKLNDKGTILKYLGQEAFKGETYDKVEVTYDAAITGKEQNDVYILYIDSKTKLIDHFYFSLPAMGINEPVIIAHYEYEMIDGQKLATRRTYFMPNEEGGYDATPSLVQTLSNIKFNNGFTHGNITVME